MFAEAFVIFRRHWWRYIALVSVVYVPVRAADVLASGLWLLLTPYGVVVGATLAQAAVARVTLSTAELRGVGLGAYRTIAPCFWRLAVASLVEPVAVMFGLLLFVVPGFLLIARWSVYIPAIVAERDSVLGFGRSAELTRGHRWTGLGVSVVPAVVMLLLIVPSIILRTGVIAWATVPFAVLVVSYGTVATAVLYRRLVAESALRKPARVGYFAVGDVPAARLASVRPDGSPRLTFVRYALEGDTLYATFEEKRDSTERLDPLAEFGRGGHVEVLIDDYDEDWSSIWWVRPRGQARVVERDERAVALLMAKYAPYQDRPPGQLIVLQIEERVRWSAGVMQQ